MTAPAERSKTIDLIDPIKSNKNETISVLTLRPPKTGERRQAEGHLRTNQSPENFTRFAVQMVAACASVGIDVIDQMYDDQFMESWTWVGSFLGGGQTSGNA